MGTKNFSNANDLITFSRSSAGTALRPISYGDELVTNGTFDTDTSGWTPVINDGDFSVIDGVARLTKGSTNPSVYQNITTNIGSVYVASLEFTGRDGADLQFSATTSSVSSSFFSTTGLVNLVFVATSSVEEMEIQLGFAVTGEWIEFDNVSVKEVLFDQGTLTLFNHPAGIPRIEYDADGNVLGLLVEESRTNVLTYSQSFESQWLKIRLTVLQNQAQAPDGSNTAVKVVPNTDNSNHYLYQTYSAGTHTWTIYAKAGEYGRISLWEGGVTAKYTSFDLNSGTKLQGNADADSITSVGNGWYRLSMTVTVASGTPYFVVAALNNEVLAYSTSFVGDGTSGIYIWGAQVEQGAFSTSYIPTSGATATRAADVASIPVSAFGYNQSAGTVVANYVTYAPNANISAEAWRLADGSDFDSTIFQYVRYSASSNQSTVFGYSESSLDIDMRLSGLAITGTYHKSATAIKENDYALSIDGSTPATDSSAGVPSVSTLHIGGDTSGSRELNGHIKSIKYYPRKLTAAQLQEQTT